MTKRTIVKKESLLPSSSDEYYHDALDFSPDTVPLFLPFLGRLDDVSASFEKALDMFQVAHQEFIAIAAKSAKSSASKSSAMTQKAPFPASYQLYDNMTPDGLSLGGARTGEEEVKVVDTTPATSIHLSQEGSSSKYSAVGFISADTDDDDGDGDDDDDGRENDTSRASRTNNKSRQARVTAKVPSLDKGIVLDATGAFVDTTVVRTARGVRPSYANSSFKMEESIMDRRKKVSYIEITSREKNEVFQLSAVRRSMRHLNYAQILMTDEVLVLSNRFMEIGPSRASLLHIGYESLQVSCDEKSFNDELDYISPLLKWVAWARGYHPFFWFVCLLAAVFDNAFFILQMVRVDNVDVVMFPIVLGCLVFMLFAMPVSASVAFASKIPLTANTPVDEIHLTGVTYLRMKGLDVLAKAQHRLAAQKNRSIAPEADLFLFKKNLVNSTMWEALTVHFLIGAIPFVCSSIMTILRCRQRGDALALLFACGSLINKLVMCLVVVHCSIHIRFAQKLSEFEVRRAEADIR